MERSAPSRSGHRRAGRAVAAVVAMVAACGGPVEESATASGVLVVAIDGLRADHLGCMGYDRPTTPTIDALADGGVVFAQTFAAAPLLFPSHMSLFTGCDPIVSRRFVSADFGGLDERRWRVPDGVPHLAVEFLAAGYRTAAFIDDPQLDPAHGFGAGFQEYILLDDEEPPREGNAPELVWRLLQWVRSGARDRPWFAYLHLADLERSWSRPDRSWTGYFKARPELDEVPPVGNTDSVFFAIPYSRWRGGSRTIGQYQASYDGHVRRLDDELGELLASLRRMGRSESTTIALVGTHGVQFGEAGLYLRGGGYSMADLHVPWVLRPREGLGVERGRTVGALTSLIDLAPTLLELEGLSEPRGMHGLSQAAWVVGPLPTESLRRYAFASCGMQEGGAVIGERFCLESLAPERLEDEILRRSWYGEENVEEGERAVRFYDRLATPFPPLNGGEVDARDEHFQEFRRVRKRWLDDIVKTRLVLQRDALVEEEGTKR